MIINKNLPEDIIIDILLNLPVKALTRFACVSKPWYSLIKGDDTFIRKHHRLNADHLLAVAKHYHSALDNVKESLSIKFRSNGITEFCADPKLCPAVEDYIDFHGHCNGILCFYNSFYGKGILWNPSNRETRVLPMFPHGYTKQRKWCGLRLGFDERTNDYKVVVFSKLDEMIYHKTISNADDYEYRFDIYSMRNDSWRRFKGHVPFYISHDNYYLKVLDGVFYWFHKDRGSSILLSFHIGNEVFEGTTLPDSMSEGLYNGTLDKYGDHIAIICFVDFIFDKNTFAIWILSSEKCWEKVLTFGFTMNMTVYGFCDHGNKVLLSTCETDPDDVRGINDRLVIYDPQSKQFNDTGFRGEYILVFYHSKSEREFSFREENARRFFK